MFAKQRCEGVSVSTDGFHYTSQGAGCCGWCCALPRTCFCLSLCCSFLAVGPPGSLILRFRNCAPLENSRENIISTSLRAIPTLHTHELCNRYHKFLHILETSTPNSQRPCLDIKQTQTGERLWRDIGGIHWRILASRFGSILAGYSAGSTGKGYSAGYSAGSTCELLCKTQWDTWRDPLQSYSDGVVGAIHWRATLRHSAGYSAGSTGGLVGYLAGFWRETRREH